MNNLFHLFTFDDYYPSGGMNDYIGSFETLEKAQHEYRTGKDYNGSFHREYAFYQIATMKDGKMIVVEGCGAE